MKNWSKITFNTVFICVLILLIALNVVGVLTKQALIIKMALPLFIPVFIILFYTKYSKLGISFISFLLFSFLGDIAPVLFSEDALFESSSVLYIMSYLFLLVMIIPEFKILEFEKIIGTYLMVVFAISLYFLYVVCEVLKELIPSNIEVLLYGVKSLILIILTFVSFGVYLNTLTKESALFLNAIVFIGLSVMLNYINLYYINLLSLEILYRVLYGIGLFLMFKFLMNNQIVIKKINKISMKQLSA